MKDFSSSYCLLVDLLPATARSVCPSISSGFKCKVLFEVNEYPRASMDINTALNESSREGSFERSE